MARRVFERGDRGGWWIDFIDQAGVRRREYGGPTKRVAQEKLDVRVREVHNGVYRRPSEIAAAARAEAADAAKAEAERQAGEKARADAATSFATVADGWLGVHTPNTARATSESYRRIVRRHLKPAFPGAVVSVTPAAVEDYVAARRGKGAKPASIGVELAALSSIMRYAVKRELLPANPVSGFQRPKLGEQRTRYLRPDEIASLLSACEHPPVKSHMPAPYLRAFVVVALETGMRRSEILSLSRATVDFSARIARLSQTKAGRERFVPLNDPAIFALRSLPPRIDGGPFFAFKPIEVTRAVAAALQRAKIAGATLHTLRHSFASLQAMRGVPLHALQQILGHADLEMVRRYSHLAGDFLRRVVDDMSVTAIAPGRPAGDSDLAPIWHQPPVTEGLGADSVEESRTAPAQNRTGT